MAMQFAAMTEMALVILEWARTGEAVKKMREVIGVADWLHLYQDAGTLLSTYADITENVDGSPGLVWFARCGQVDSAAQEAAQAKLKNAPEAVLKVVEKALHEIFKQTYRDNLSEVLDVIKDRDRHAQLSDEDMARPELQFLLLVVFPCILETGESPWQLYERAKAGQKDALLDLIRIDKKVIADPAIAAQLEKPTMERDPVLAEMIGKAFGDGVNYNPSRGQIKAQAGAAIIKTSESMGWKLKPIEIRALFNAIERDRWDDESLEDDDLPEFDEGWRQAIQRGKSRWKIDLPRDAFPSDSRYASFLRHLVISAGDAEGSLPEWVNAVMQQGQQPKRGIRAWIRRLRGKLALWALRQQEEQERRKRMARRNSDS